MEKLTKKQRHEIYKKALDKYDYFNSKYNAGVLGGCEAINCIINGHFSQDNEVITKKYFPEFFLFKDATSEYMWLDLHEYEAMNTRIEFIKLVLMFCIEMTR